MCFMYHWKNSRTHTFCKSIIIYEVVFFKFLLNCSVFLQFSNFRAEHFTTCYLKELSMWRFPSYTDFMRIVLKQMSRKGNVHGYILLMCNLNGTDMYSSFVSIILQIVKDNRPVTMQWL